MAPDRCDAPCHISGKARQAAAGRRLPLAQQEILFYMDHAHRITFLLQHVSGGLEAIHGLITGAAMASCAT